MEPYLYSYNQAIHLRDKYKSFWNFTKNLFTGNVFSEIRNYHAECVEKTKKDYKQLMILLPSYFASFVLLKNIYHRICLGVANNMFLRLITEKKKKAESKYAPASNPAYA